MSRFFFAMLATAAFTGLATCLQAQETESLLLAQWKYRTITGPNQPDRELLIVPVQYRTRVLPMTDADIKNKEAEERPVYLSRITPSYRLAPDNTLLKPKDGLLPGYSIGKNEASHRAMCGGNALGYLLRKATPISTDDAWRVVSTFGEKVTGTPEVGDIVVWKKTVNQWRANQNGVAEHFAWVSDPMPSSRGGGLVMIHTKSDNGLVWVGPLYVFPLPNEGGWDSQYAIYRLDFDTIDAFRDSARLATVPRASGKVVEKDLSATVPRWPWPWIQRAVIGTCNEITQELRLPAYELTFDGKSGMCEARWKRTNNEGGGFDLFILRMSGPWTRSVSQEMVRTYGRMVSQYPPRPEYTPVQLGGFPGERIAVAPTCEYRWAHRGYFCDVIAADGLRRPPGTSSRSWLYDQQLVRRAETEALARNTVYADKMRDLFLAQLKRHGLDRPVRSDFPLDEISGPTGK